MVVSQRLNRIAEIPVMPSLVEKTPHLLVPLTPHPITDGCEWWGVCYLQLQFFHRGNPLDINPHVLMEFKVTSSFWLNHHVWRRTPHLNPVNFNSLMLSPWKWVVISPWNPMNFHQLSIYWPHSSPEFGWWKRKPWLKIVSPSSHDRIFDDPILEQQPQHHQVPVFCCKV